jgi:hypothetical protein
MIIGELTFGKPDISRGIPGVINLHYFMVLKLLLTFILFIFQLNAFSQGPQILKEVIIEKKISVESRIKKIINSIDKNYIKDKDVFFQIMHLATENIDTVLFVNGKISVKIPGYKNLHNRLYGDFISEKDTQIICNSTVFKKWYPLRGSIYESNVPWYFPFYISSGIEKIGFNNFPFLDKKSQYEIQYEYIDNKYYRLNFNPKIISNNCYYKGYVIINKEFNAIEYIEYNNIIPYLNDGSRVEKGSRAFNIVEDNIAIRFSQKNGLYSIQEINIKNVFTAFNPYNKEVKNYKSDSSFKTVDSFIPYKAHSRLDYLNCRPNQ